MSGCNSLRGRLAAWMHSGGWWPPPYKRLKPKLLGALGGEVTREAHPGTIRKVTEALKVEPSELTKEQEH